VIGIPFEDLVERLPRLPVLIPARPPSARAELQPDVVEIDLSEQEEGGLVVGRGLKPRTRERAGEGGFLDEGGEEIGAGRAGLPRPIAVARTAERPPDLEMQARRAQLARR
jgi:hypothetical protein